jgi:proteasome lid subunit RPN8/RPN11
MTAGFTVTARKKDRAPFRAREPFYEGALSFLAPDGFAALVTEPAALELERLARAAAPREFLGIVCGHQYEDGGGEYVVVQGVVPVVGATATEVAVASTASAALAAENEAERIFPGARVLGWCHSHPGYGAWYSAVDRANQATYRSATALGIVVDPWCATDRGLAVYRGPQSERLTLSRADRASEPGTPSSAGNAAEPVAPDEPNGRTTTTPVARWAARVSAAALTANVMCVLLLVAMVVRQDHRLGALERAEVGRVVDTVPTQCPACACVAAPGDPPSSFAHPELAGPRTGSAPLACTSPDDETVEGEAKP